MTLPGSSGGRQRQNGVGFKNEWEVKGSECNRQTTQKRLGITSEMEGGNCSEEHSATARPLSRSDTRTSLAPGHTPRSLRTTECSLTDHRPGTLDWNQTAWLLPGSKSPSQH